MLTYDPLGRLWRIASPVHGKTDFVYDGAHVAVEYDGDTGGIRRRFFWGPGADEPILQDEGGAMNCSGTRVLHGDERGSVVAAADCFGVRQAVNTYDESGNPAAGNWGRYGYTGQAWLPELGLWFYKNRMYSPSLGRFMQTDPIGYGDGLNLYAYVGGDPVNRVDPSGLTQYCADKTVSSDGTIEACDGHGGPGDIVTDGGGGGGSGGGFGGFGGNGGAGSGFGGGSGGVFVPPPLVPPLTGAPPQDDEGEDVVVTAAKKIAQCAADQFGLNDIAAAGAGISGMNTLETRGKFAGAVPGTSPASKAASAVFGRAQLPFRVPTIVGNPLTLRAGIRMTASVARVVGRGIPVIGWALLAYDLAATAVCVASDD